ncbi:CST complex subunit TEN1 isoform X2 [Eulemur rufifrons]
MMLPKPGIYYLPWEVSAGQVPDGGTLRTFGRLCLYDVTQSRAKLTAQHDSDQHELLVCTKLVEPFQAQEGSLYVVLGELEPQEDGGPVVKARVLTCVEGMNLPLLEQAIQEQRRYQQERGGGPQEMAAPTSTPDGGPQEMAAPTGTPDGGPQEMAAPTGTPDGGPQEMAAPDGTPHGGPQEMAAPAGTPDGGPQEMAAPTGTPDGCS